MATRTAYVATALEVLTAANLNTHMKGVLGFAEITSDQTGISSVVDLTGTSLSVTIPADRVIAVLGYFGRVSSLTAGDIVNFRIEEDASQVAEARIDVGQVASGSNGGATAWVAKVYNGKAAGTYTWNLSGGLATGTGTVQFRASATAPGFIVVADLGPSLS